MYECIFCVAMVTDMKKMNDLLEEDEDEEDEDDEDEDDSAFTTIDLSKIGCIVVVLLIKTIVVFNLFH